ncbi:Flagellar biosynthetic protein FliP precursor [Enhygromyxa salina]|uniref:Flagellar biosynthetic protein FliP n=1 Tax=Enhygromyxa salina TaxID=215803 RepID=A0A2S9XF60_9BACT|nr:EscR/YscR/HrcR family type III secretion system export apparatus protein [Enhygromyxa salina]PRP91503.1 Flagellar biosynthetic protein FliP precursor [Enhygromyxa salina]
MGAELGLPANVSGWLILASLPLLLAACTAFTKISVVLGALRLGLGAERLLPFGSILALALVLTALVMAPVAYECLDALELAGGIAAVELAPLERGPEILAPLWNFLAEHAKPGELELFAELSGQAPEQPVVLVPAFLVSELGHGLALAVLILLPFVVVDLICAQVLVLLGLNQTPTAVIALPAKILLFLAADGWGTVIVGLVEGYR